MTFNLDILSLLKNKKQLTRVFDCKNAFKKRFYRKKTLSY